MSRRAPAPSQADLDALSREFALLCDEQGVLIWHDERAPRLVNATLGVSLHSLAVPGTEPKIEFMLQALRRGDEARFEISLRDGGRPVTVAMRGSRTERGLLFVGSLVAQEFGDALSQLESTMTELSEMHRQSEKQRFELARLHGELGDSSRALLTMHGELDDKLDSLRRADEIRTRLVANVSHEFRTPLNSILGLSRLLLDRVDGELSVEQERQLRFIRQSAESLAEMVNDLLDLSKAEAGKHRLNPRTFRIEDLLGALRGMMQPLLTNQETRFVVEEPPTPVSLDTDESKVAQVLRNLVTNALKFTENGEVRVTAMEEGDMVVFRVIDTGIGIAPENLEHIFDEFSQIDSEVQRRVKGTGLGLALSRRFAQILGGTLTAESTLGKGSTFTLRIPRVHEEVAAMETIASASQQIDPSRAPVLVVEDDRQTMFLYERYLTGSGFQVIPARTIEDARRCIDRVRPAAIVLDVMLDGESTWTFLAQLKDAPATRDIPVMVVTVVDRLQKARALGADEFWLKPVDRERLVRKLGELARRGGSVPKILIIDDDSVARYLIRRLLSETPYHVIEAANGAEGVRLARLEQPSLIMLDFFLGDATAFDVLDDLKVDPRTRGIPVIIQTSKELADVERERLAVDTSAILSKQNLSRELAIARIREALLNAGVKVEAGHGHT